MKQLMKGNEALAEASVRAGCRFYGGYPITPQSEILEYLSWRLPEVGGHFIQSESELAGINMVYGAVSAGFRAMTSSAGPGFSLKQEGISYIASAELPCVVVDVMRYGNGLGDITPGQSDYFQAVKGGGHGDYQTIVFAPSSVQENIDYTFMAFNKAEEYRNPVIVLSDGAIGQMMEPVELPPMVEHDPEKFDWAVKGKGNGKHKIITSRIYYDFGLNEYDKHVRDKYLKIKENEQLWESVEVSDAEIVLVSYGISSRSCKEAVKIARNKGIKLGLIRPITVWPFPVKAFNKVSKNIKGYIAVEMSATGQMVEDVALAVRGKSPIYLYPSGRFVPESEKILDMVDKIYKGELKEVY